MKAVSGKHLCQLLEEHGWILKRTTSSQHIHAKPGYPTRISVPVHGKSALKIRLHRHLMKLAAIDESEL
ncbi:type II toxin-antitoxin system HicA family toxin [uncultured Thiohalocapsa sp.]|uniref:type II toxin-antitoxin system HicA family toxin n=1 Tax=uncultured Thiohalocapsa sp. TaxID=768990 RepID=UPI0025FF7FBC|nr:type II toxin-antitoxin system HicA family toxin [uncultured Thiohalocapsa sp.]